MLWHCTQGKDRTGVAALLLLFALGFSLEQAMEEYLLSNQQMQANYDDLVAAGASEQDLRLARIMLFVQRNLLENYVWLIQEQHSSLSNYLDFLGVDAAARQQLRSWYTC